MPKAKVRRRAGAGKSVASSSARARSMITQASSTSATAAPTAGKRAASPPAKASAFSSNIQGLIMYAMVALGCWGLAISFAVFSKEANHLLFAGMAVLMALMWSFGLGIRLRKVIRQK